MRVGVSFTRLVPRFVRLWRRRKRAGIRPLFITETLPLLYGRVM